MSFFDTSATGADSSGERLLTDFTPGSPDLGWYVVNDNVMGGRSEGGFDLNGERLHFSGRTNTDGGGFSSIRTKDIDLDLSEFSGIRLHVKGDGRRYTWRLATSASWRGRQIGYWADFDTRKGDWTTVDIPFADFVAQVRGKRLDGPVLDIADLKGMGLMIYDNEDGPFDLELNRVSAFNQSL